MTTTRPDPGPLAAHWDLDPAVTFLNHGSFGACPRAVLAAQAEWRARLEREPVRFFIRELPGALEGVRATLGALLGAQADDLALVPNATTGVSTVLRGIGLQPGDELVTTDHAYGACKNALDAIAAERGATVVVARVPLPTHPDAVVEAVLRTLTKRTRLALLDWVTSPTGLVFPMGQLVTELGRRGVDVLVDGAHAPGMVPMALDHLGAAYTTGNLHKWLCTPKGSAFLHVRRDRQAGLRPLVISHGATAPLRGRSRFQVEFEWTGTFDPTPWLVLPDAVRTLEGLVPGGLPALRQRNRSLALEGRRLLERSLGAASLAPDEMIGALAAVALPDGPPGEAMSAQGTLPLQDALFERFAVEVPIVPWPALPKRLVRISAQLHNAIEQVAWLAGGLKVLLAEERR